MSAGPPVTCPTAAKRAYPALAAALKEMQAMRQRRQKTGAKKEKSGMTERTKKEKSGMTERRTMSKVYLGDSVYVEVEHGRLKLTTENGYGPVNTIYLEHEVMSHLLALPSRAA